MSRILLIVMICTTIGGVCLGRDLEDRSLPLPVGIAVADQTLEVQGYRCTAHDQTITCVDTGPTCQAVKKRAEQYREKIFGCAAPGSKNYPCDYEINTDAREQRWRESLDMDCEPKSFIERKCDADLENCTQ